MSKTSLQVLPAAAQRSEISSVSVTPSLDEPLRFERLLAELSARFISLPPSEVDGQIEAALRAIVETLDLDRSHLARFIEEDGTYRSVHSWVRSGLPRASTGDLTNKFPWSIRRLLAGKAVIFTSIDELPAEAYVDRASLNRTGVRSQFHVPLNVGGRVVGGLGFATIGRERVWSADLLSRLSLVAEIFGNALARKSAQTTLQELLGFERLLADIAATLVAVPVGEVDAAIERGLHRIAAFLDLDRATLWELDADGISLRASHSWSADGTCEPQKGDLVTMPWMIATIRANEPVRVARLDELPNEAAIDKATLALQSTRSLLMVPIRVAGAVTEAISFATIRRVREWPSEFVPRIRLVGEVLAAALRAERDQSALAHMARVSVLGQLSASIAHQLNQPLTAILTNAETAQRMLAKDRFDVVELREICDDIVSENHRAAEVIVRLRALFKRNELQLKQLDLNELIRETLDLVRTELVLHQVSLITDFSSSLPALDADRVQLQQVLLNLIVNATEALKPVVGQQRKLTIRTYAVDAAVRVCVIDSGPGIAAEQLPRVFDPFWSTKPGGMGIGLAICRAIVVAHGGSLIADHNPEGGAIFCAAFPVRQLA